MPSDPRDDFLRKQLEIMDTYGWSLIFVGSDEDSPAFTYTVGLSKYGHPELIISGLSYNVTGSILNDLGQRIKEGLKLSPGDALSDVIANYDVKVVAASAEQTADRLTIAAHFFNSPTFTLEALQILWPDPQGNFPGDPEFSLPLAQEDLRA